jgi:hypothetical protein
MSFKEVKELRKAGKLEEALELALSDFQKVQDHYNELRKDAISVGELRELFPELKESETKDLRKLGFSVPTDILWAKRSLAWVYYDFLKKFAKPDSYDSFKEYLIKVSDLKLPEDEKMIFDQIAFQTGGLVFAMQKEEHVDFGKIGEIFDLIRNFSFSKPSEAYSFLFKAFHKGYQNWSRYLEFADWWGFDNLRTEDFLEDEYNGKKIMATAEQAYIAYSKKLLEGEATDPSEQHWAINKERVREFLPQLDRIIEKYPGYQYPPYFKAKLLMALGEEENVLSTFLPFAKKKRNDFWVWEIMAEAFPDDADIQFACYCKALSLKTPENYLVKTRQTFAAMLIGRNLFKEARAEVDRIIETRTENSWKIPYQVTSWTEQEWYKSAAAGNDNGDFYKKHLSGAEEILFQDIPEEVVVVEFVNEDKRILNFIRDREKYGFFSYRGHLDKAKTGDILAVRFGGEGKDGFYKALTVRKCAPNTNTEAIKSFEGSLKVLSPQGIGFVDDVFFDQKQISANKLTDGQVVKGQAILSFNKKKNQWGWKFFEIVK